MNTLLTPTDLKSIAHNTLQGHEERVLRNMLEEMAQISNERPETWKALIREVAPNIDNTSPIDTFRALLEECQEMNLEDEDRRELEFQAAADRY